MTVATKIDLTNNPIHFSDERSLALNEAFVILMEVFSEYASQNELTPDQIQTLSKQIIDAYLELKASYYLENKLADFSDYLRNAIIAALSDSWGNGGREKATKLFYYNNKLHLISHEQRV